MALTSSRPSTSEHSRSSRAREAFSSPGFGQLLSRHRAPAPAPAAVAIIMKPPPSPSLLKSVVLPSVITSSATGLTIGSIWSGVDSTELASSISEASSSALSTVSEFSSADDARMQEAKIRAVQKIRAVSVFVPTAAVGSGTLLGCAAARKLADRFRFVRKYGLIRVGVPLLLGSAGTLGGGAVGVHFAVAAVIGVGNKAVLGVVLAEMGAPDWISGLLV